MIREQRMITGKIIKGIGGFYYVAAEDGKIYETKARGLFRKDGVKPLVGDDCGIEVTDSAKCLGSILSILPRRSMLIRPAVANTDQAIVIFAVSRPEPHTGLMDRYLVGMEHQDCPVTVVLNKIDADQSTGDRLAMIYRHAGYRVVQTSAKRGDGLEELREILKGKTSVLSGPSGVGKSSLLNALFPDYSVKTGEISEKIGRGKHTTRHSELMVAGEQTYLCDTPGFSSVELPPDLEEDGLVYCYPEMKPHIGACRFSSCRHLAEPECSVKQAVETGEIEKSRYESYVAMMELLKQRRKY